MPELRPDEQPFFIQHLLAVTVITALGVAIYSNTLNSPFFFDDGPNIQENRFIRLTQFSPEQLYTAAFRNHETARPLSYLSFALNYYFGEYHVTGYHVVNIGIHVINGVLVYLLALAILRQLDELQHQGPPRFDQRWQGIVSLTAALIFVAHPIQTQAVTYIVQRMTSLAAMFYLMAVLFYIYGRRSRLKSQRWALWGGCLVSAGLAMGSKQIAATLPVMLLVVEWYFFQDLSTLWLKRNYKVFIGLLVLLGLVAFFYLGTEPWKKFSGYRDHEFTMGERVLTQFRVLVFYLSLIAVPIPSRLNLLHDFSTSHSLTDPISTLICMVMILGLAVFAVLVARRLRLISFCIWWFLINLMIESSIFPLEMVYEHRMYLPMFGVALLSSQLLFRWLADKRVLAAVLAGAAVLALAMASHVRNRAWADELTLWSDVVSKSPELHRGQNNLGQYLARAGRLEEAEQHLREAIRLSPVYGKARNNLGMVLMQKGRYREAESLFRQAVNFNRRNTKAHANLASVLDKQGRYKEATRHLTRVLRLEPENTAAHNYLGVVLAKRGMLQNAVAHWEEALRLDPANSQAYNNLSILLIKQENYSEAEKLLRKALTFNPENSKALNNLAVVLVDLGRFEESEKHLSEALRLDPDYADAYKNLGVVTLKLGRYAEAIANCRKAIEINDRYWESMNNLAWIYATCPDERFRDAEEAVRLAERVQRLAGRKEPGYLSTLAAAYAEAGRFEDATEAATTAIQIAESNGQEQLALQVEEQLDLYQQGRPYREVRSRKP